MRIRPSALIIQEQQLLTLKYTYPGGVIYALPGGNLEFGENLKDALERELQEELGIEAAISDLHTIAEVLFEGKNTIHIVFHCSGFKGDIVLNPSETTAEAYEWLALEELHKYTLYPNIGFNITASQPQTFLGLVEQPHY